MTLLPLVEWHCREGPWGKIVQPLCIGSNHWTCPGRSHFPIPSSQCFEPSVPDTLSVEPWPLGTATGADLLAWLGGAFARRPLLGLTPPLWDSEGAPIRGLSPLGRGVALVSTRSLSSESLLGVVRHEMGHAFGMGHCESWDCASVRGPTCSPFRTVPLPSASAARSVGTPSA